MIQQKVQVYGEGKWGHTDQSYDTDCVLKANRKGIMPNPSSENLLYSKVKNKQQHPNIIKTNIK
jgi:hypothetical protein